MPSFCALAIFFLNASSSKKRDPSVFLKVFFDPLFLHPLFNSIKVRCCAPRNRDVADIFSSAFVYHSNQNDNRENTGLFTERFDNAYASPARVDSRVVAAVDTRAIDGCA